MHDKSFCTPDKKKIFEDNVCKVYPRLRKRMD